MVRRHSAPGSLIADVLCFPVEMAEGGGECTIEDRDCQLTHFNETRVLKS